MFVFILLQLKPAIKYFSAIVLQQPARLLQHLFLNFIADIHTCRKKLCNLFYCSIYFILLHQKTKNAAYQRFLVTVIATTFW